MDIYEGSYFVIEVSNDGTATAKAIYEYSSYTDAVRVFHQTLASMMSNAAVKWGLVQVINEYGTASKTERFERNEA